MLVVDMPGELMMFYNWRLHVFKYATFVFRFTGKGLWYNILSIHSSHGSAKRPSSTLASQPEYK